MNRIIIPTIIIVALTSVICTLAVKEFSDAKRRSNPAYKKINGITDEADKNKDSDADKNAESEEVLSKERLTANDTCILMRKNLKDKELYFRNVKGGKEKILGYDGKTVFISKNEQPLVADELRVGDILDVTFTTFDSLLSEVKPAKIVWENSDITKFKIDDRGKTIQIGSSLYMLNEDVLVVSDDKIGELLDITNLDNITVKGIDKEIYSIRIDKGHGYIRVLNDTYFVGGWIEIGQDIIRTLSQDMLIPVPEGEYTVKVANKGYVGKQKIVVKRDKEAKLDLSKVEIEEVAIGHVLFNIVPDYAQLFIDGIITDFEERIPLEYGVHSVRAELAGYETVNANIRVGTELADITIELDEDPNGQSYDKEDEDNSDNLSYKEASGSFNSTSSSAGTSSSSSDSSSSSSTSLVIDSVLSDNKKLYVQSPQGAEVYFDGKYIGIAPCSTQKIVGDHSVTLAKDGYETKSYTVNILNDNNDLTMSFSELVKVE